MGCGDDRSQPIDGRLSQQDVVGGVGVDYQILILDTHARLPLAESGVKLDISSGATLSLEKPTKWSSYNFISSSVILICLNVFQ